MATPPIVSSRSPRDPEEGHTKRFEEEQPGDHEREQETTQAEDRVRHRRRLTHRPIRRRPMLRLDENRAMTRPSMYEFAGGDPAFLALAAAHHKRCLEDPVLNHPFSHPDQHPQHVERLAWYWAEAFGGPTRYSDSCGGQPAMLSIHALGGEVEDKEDFGARFVACFVHAADDVSLPDDPEFRAGLRAYMEWAVADVFSYSPDTATLVDRPVPLWSWDGLQ
jgi:hemoglobin